MAPTLSPPLVLRAGSLLVAGVVVGGVALTALAGCGSGVPTRLDFSDTEKVKVTEIVVTGGSGDVVVRTAPIAETRINRVLTYRDVHEPGATYRLAGTVLTVDTDCGRTCSVSYDIEAPAGVAVSGELGSGDVTMTNVGSTDLQVGSGDINLVGATGAVTLGTRSGDIRVRDLTGASQLSATSGDIDGSGLGGGAIVADAKSGNIQLKLSRPGSVTAKATSGDITLVVPDAAYQVRTSANSGDSNVDVPNDAAGKFVLDVHANSGDVTVSRG
jgi:hypothetical protein